MQLSVCFAVVLALAPLAVDFSDPIAPPVDCVAAPHLVHAHPPVPARQATRTAARAAVPVPYPLPQPTVPVPGAPVAR